MTTELFTQIISLGRASWQAAYDNDKVADPSNHLYMNVDRTAQWPAAEHRSSVEQSKLDV